MRHTLKIHSDWHVTLLSYIKLGIIILFEIGLKVYDFLREFLNTPTKMHLAIIREYLQLTPPLFYKCFQFTQPFDYNQTRPNL